MECKTEQARQALWKGNERRRVAAENNVARLAFGEVEALEELWVGEKRVARRCGGNGVSWIWERKSDDMVDAALIGMKWAEYRKEREAVVVSREMGT